MATITDTVMEGLTVFGSRTSSNKDAVAAQLTLLYGSKKLTVKQLKQLEKLAKVCTAFLSFGAMWTLCNSTIHSYPSPP